MLKRGGWTWRFFKILKVKLSYSITGEMTMFHEGLPFLETSCSRERQLCFRDWPRLWSGENKKIWEFVCFKGDESRGQHMMLEVQYLAWKSSGEMKSASFQHRSCLGTFPQCCFYPLGWLLLVVSSPIPGKWASTLANTWLPCVLSLFPEWLSSEDTGFLGICHVVCCLAAMLLALAFKSLFLPTELLKPTNFWSWWAFLLLQMLANWLLRNKKYNEPPMHTHTHKLLF